METKNCNNCSQQFYCEKCDYLCSRKQQYQNHIKSRKHLGNTICSQQYYCEKCDYTCSLKHHLEIHFKSRKHLGNTNCSQKPTDTDYVCKCGNKYESRSGLWKHKQKCGEYLNNEKNNSYNKKYDIVTQLIQSNSEWQSIIKEIIKNGINNTTNTNCNNHNTFNLQIYLNETCKNAMNLSEFIETIKPTIQELELTGREGYVKGISHIVTTRLNEFRTEEKPIQCSDGKREILYIKENDIWNKEDDEKPLLTSAIKKVAHRNLCNISEWQKLNPDCTDSDSRKNDLYLKIVSNSMPGLSKEESDNNHNKIISSVAKNTVIPKLC